MKPAPLITGYLASTVGGAFALWLLVDVLAWGYLAKHGVTNKGRAIMTLPMGMVERFLYTTVFVINQPAFVAVWLPSRLHHNGMVGRDRTEARTTSFALETRYH